MVEYLLSTFLAMHVPDQERKQPDRATIFPRKLFRFGQLVILEEGLLL